MLFQFLPHLHHQGSIKGIVMLKIGRKQGSAESASPICNMLLETKSLQEYEHTRLEKTFIFTTYQTHLLELCQKYPDTRFRIILNMTANCWKMTAHMPNSSCYNFVSISPANPHVLDFSLVSLLGLGINVQMSLFLLSQSFYLLLIMSCLSWSNMIMIPAICQSVTAMCNSSHTFCIMQSVCLICLKSYF